MKDNTNAWLAFIAGVAIVLIGGLIYYLVGPENTPIPAPGTPDGSGTATTTDNGTGTTTGLVSQVNLAFLDTAGTASGPERGCDKLVMVPHDIQPTVAPLSAALTQLFTIDDEQVNNYYNFIARTNETLAFQRAEVIDGTANIYLTGELTGLAGVCDDPRASIQIEETALQFETVDDVQLYLNGEETDLRPDLSGQGN